MWGSVKVVGVQWTSTGNCRVDFERPRGLVKAADYDIFCQSLTSGQKCVVTGIYSTYFTVEVRDRNNALANLEFSFLMVGDNY